MTQSLANELMINYFYLIIRHNQELLKQLWDQKMARCRSARKSYPKLKVLQQLTSLIGNDVYRERIMKWWCYSFVHHDSSWGLLSLLEGSGSWKYNQYFPVAEGEGKMVFTRRCWQSVKEGSWATGNHSTSQNVILIALISKYIYVYFYILCSSWYSCCWGSWCGWLYGGLFSCFCGAFGGILCGGLLSGHCFGCVCRRVCFCLSSCCVCCH